MRKFFQKCPIAYIIIPLSILYWWYEASIGVSLEKRVIHLCTSFLLLFITWVAIFFFKKGWKAGNEAKTDSKRSDIHPE
jgi:hypothetical protein